MCLKFSSRESSLFKCFIHKYKPFKESLYPRLSLHNHVHRCLRESITVCASDRTVLRYLRVAMSNGRGGSRDVGFGLSVSVNKHIRRSLHRR